MDTCFNIVEFIENNPVTKLSKQYQSKLLTKIKSNFTESQQQMFVSSFYCYLNYHSHNDYVIDLDNIWNWLGFSQKVRAKELLEKCFKINIDYKKLLSPQRKQNTQTKGGHNKETFMLNIETFKKFSLKVGTTKAYEIHDYFVKLEKVLQEVIHEESNELKIQLDKIENEKDEIREKTLLEQFSNNVQCVYYGTIDNISDKNESLIKFGNSNNLNNRVKCHKDTYINFRLINAFKVDNKLQIENAIKENTFLNERLRTISIKNKKYVELLNANDLSFIKLDKTIKEIITGIEYSPENYIKLLEENKLLKTKLEEKNNTDNTNNLIILTTENERLKNENIIIIKKYNKLKKLTQTTFDDNTIDNVVIEETQNYDNIINTFKTNELNKVYKKNKDGIYTINDKKYKYFIGSREDVWYEKAFKTTGGLKKQDLMINVTGKIVSKKKSILEKVNNRLEKVNELRSKTSFNKKIESI
jgi:hypothetical protein